MKISKSFTRTKNFIVFNLLLSLLLVACNENKAKETSKVDPPSSEVKFSDEKVQAQPEPFALDIEEATLQNENYRQVSWTGEHMQLVFMSIAANEEIDLEIHNELDQFIRVEEGKAQILLGKNKDDLNIEKNIEDDWAVLIPAGYWHIVKNTGGTPLKVYVLYAPASHPEGTVHKTYEEAREYAEEHGH